MVLLYMRSQIIDSIIKPNISQSDIAYKENIIIIAWWVSNIQTAMLSNCYLP